MFRKSLIFLLVVGASAAGWVGLRTYQERSAKTNEQQIVEIPVQEVPTSVETLLASPVSSPVAALPVTGTIVVQALSTPTVETVVEESPEEVPPTETPVLEYTAEDVQGIVQARPSGGGSLAVTEGMVLEVGETVLTGSDGSAVLALNDETHVRVDPGSEITLENLSGSPMGRFESMWKLLKGAVMSQVQDLKKNNSRFEVKSGGFVCGVRGTVFEVVNTGGQVETVTHHGSVGVRSGNAPEEFVEAGRAVRFSGGRVVLRRAIQAADRRRFEAWNTRRARVLEKRRVRIEDFHRLRLQRWHEGARIRRENLSTVSGPKAAFGGGRPQGTRLDDQGRGHFEKSKKGLHQGTDSRRQVPGPQTLPQHQSVGVHAAEPGKPGGLKEKLQQWKKNTQERRVVRASQVRVQNPIDRRNGGKGVSVQNGKLKAGQKAAPAQRPKKPGPQKKTGWRKKSEEKQENKSETP